MIIDRKCVCVCVCGWVKASVCSLRCPTMTQTTRFSLLTSDFTRLMMSSQSSNVAPPSSPRKSITKTHFTFDTQYTADCVEWCPLDPSIVVVGTYFLDNPAGQGEQEGSQEGEGSVRRGRLYAFASRNENTDESCSGDSGNSYEHLESLQREIDCGGILDIKWCWHRHGGMALLGHACSDGVLKVTGLTPCESTGSRQWVDVAALSDFEEQTGMCLSLDWSNRVDGRSVWTMVLVCTCACA